MNAQLRTWLIEGRCPNCGQLGSLDAFGGARCSLHGLYEMTLNIPPEEPETTPIKDQYPGIKECWDHYLDLQGYTGKREPFEARILNTITYERPLTQDALEFSFTAIKSLGEKICIVGINPNYWLELPNLHPTIVDRVFEPLCLKHHNYGMLWGVQLFVDENVPEGYVYVVSGGNNEPENVVILTPEP